MRNPKFPASQFARSMRPDPHQRAVLSGSPGWGRATLIMQSAMKCQLLGPCSFCSLAWERQSVHLPFSRAHLAFTSCHFHLVMVEPLVIVSDFLSDAAAGALAGPAGGGCCSAGEAWGGAASAGAGAWAWPNAQPPPKKNAASAAAPRP